MSEYTPEATLDAKGLKCPMPVVKTSKEIKNVSVGGILESISWITKAMVDCL